VRDSKLVHELAPLEAQIEKARQKHEALEGELRAVEAELSKFSGDRQRFDALRDACNALDKLGELDAGKLFWEGIAGVKDAAGHVEQVKNRISRFEGKISGVLEKQRSLQEQIQQCLGRMGILQEEVREVYDREDRRKEEFVVEREVSSVPYHAMVMPWSKGGESEIRFRRAVHVALLVCLVLGGPISLIHVPLPDRSSDEVKIPERLVQLVKEEMPKPPPVQKPLPKEVKKEPKEAKKETKPKPEDQKPEEPPKVAAIENVTAAARKKAETVGVMKFKDAFADLMKEASIAKVGTEARLGHQGAGAKGQAMGQRSLVAMQAKDASSGGIGNAGVSRNVGNGNADRLGGGVSFTRVESSLAGLEESARPIQKGVAAGRTDEEIQIVFDRYKASLYRIYNQELRRDPTLRGRILMRITIDPDGEVSLCKLESTDLASADLVSKILERIRRFNFGPKENVQKLTILYPIDFFPAG
jgi:hypothetical protein